MKVMGGQEGWGKRCGGWKWGLDAARVTVQPQDECKGRKTGKLHVGGERATETGGKKNKYETRT